MKKYIILFIFCIFPLSLFAQMSFSKVQQVIYDPVIKEEQKQSLFSSPLALGFSMYRMHMVLAHGGIFESFSSYEYVNLIVSLKDIATYNILDILEFEIDRLGVMNSYLDRLNSYILQSDVALSNIKEEMSLLDYSVQYCLSQKVISDKQYLDAVQFPYQQIFLQESLENSKRYAQCASDAKIEYNAKKVLVDKLTVYNSVIKVKYDYLSVNKDDIVQHYDFMKNDVLERLILIKRILEKYDL